MNFIDTHTHLFAEDSIPTGGSNPNAIDHEVTKLFFLPSTEPITKE